VKGLMSTLFDGARQAGPAHMWVPFFAQLPLATAGYAVIASWLLMRSFDHPPNWLVVSRRKPSRGGSEEAVVGAADGEGF